ncbi:hypothetical protein R3P38DRAFT_3182495 [Favolaschia claudopus]|uniref:Uncharacterized protein n=1 Tax=Favolaschia claudopus TaxID=2862362 RepID=A0AAW0CFU9_9AGAR
MTPDEQHLTSWLLTKPGLTYRSTAEAMRSERPLWSVSEKRLRKLRQMTRDRFPTIVTLAASAGCRDRDALFEDMVPHIPSEQLRSQENQIPTVDQIASVMGTTEVKRIARFYERRADTLAWYYEVYAAETTLDGAQHNTIAQLFAGPETTVGGMVAFVKNGPIEGEWSPDIDTLALVKDIWWYRQSGTRPAEVTAGRELERFLVNNL